MGQCLSPSASNPSPNEKRELNDASKTLSTGDGYGSDKESKKKKFTRRTSAHNGIMQSIAIKFPHVKRSFLACKEVFDKYSQGGKRSGEDAFVHKSDIRKLLIELGAREADLSDEEVDRIIKTANLDGDDKIDFKEFLIAAAVGCFLGHDVKDQSQEFLSIRKGFAVAEEAFQKIDKDGSGEIDFEELKTAFLAMRQDDLILMRLKELDFNGDKTVEFPEFVWGISAWVGMDEADDADAEDVQSDMNIQKNAEHSADIQEINRTLTTEQ